MKYLLGYILNILNYIKGVKFMKNQEIKEKSGLVLEKLSDNELEIITAGMDFGSKSSESFVFDFFAGFMITPLSIKNLIFGPENKDDLPRAQAAGFLVSAVGLSAVLEVVCYGIYKGGSAVVRKLKRKPVNKVARQDATVPADENGLQV